MATRLPGALPRRPTISIIPSSSTALTHPLALKPSHTPLSHTPSRAATIIRRPRRPYAFTQLVQQTDGSTYTVRTTSPIALYKSLKDTRNHVLWQPSDSSLRNVEVDEAGKLAAFRRRFGRGWDMEKAAEPSELDKLEAAAGGKEGETEKSKEVAAEQSEDTLSDMVAWYALKGQRRFSRKKFRGKGKK
ncbi:uncharacterized protein GGS22DRAFT_18566 [Annulohypoxylon maeteangense]|uniref:uncharacterized protein n=1 Tax=Annulohypoxylon maeteangense TaxID=1927788 RepID=UPI002007BF3D|nr:uncharacterized protein GGS22DRAFT_18566 [Annulohypoxylon maeteangense]KAI0884055.1 hypothetical protein GGS22DRAFT_18566 [Annulohypoxylon maeteangense]